jgi:hypothetical protein
MLNIILEFKYLMSSNSRSCWITKNNQKKRLGKSFNARKRHHSQTRSETPQTMNASSNSSTTPARNNSTNTATPSTPLTPWFEAYSTPQTASATTPNLKQRGRKLDPTIRRKPMTDEEFARAFPAGPMEPK